MFFKTNFNFQFNEHCLAHCKSAFVGIPLASCFLILGIVAALQWAPYHHKTLKKPGFIAAFFFSLILVSINIGQIVSILVPMINPNATPDRPGTNQDNRAKCGYSTEVIAVSTLILFFHYGTRRKTQFEQFFETIRFTKEVLSTSCIRLLLI